MKKQVHTYTQSYDSVRAKPCKKVILLFFPLLPFTLFHIFLLPSCSSFLSGIPWTLFAADWVRRGYCFICVCLFQGKREHVSKVLWDRFMDRQHPVMSDS